MSQTQSEVMRGLDVQRRVIGALIMREIHTRYGRENIGYLWMFVEPCLLAAAVAGIHLGQQSTHFGTGVGVIPFTLTGYCLFIIFRSIITRAEATLEANKPLLFHRMVTIFDMLLARAVLEAIATTATLGLLIMAATAFGWAELPARPLTLLGAILFMFWFSLGLSMSVSAASYMSKAVGKFVHPVTYILMPISGAFFQLRWIPEPYRTWLSWSPLNQIFEMAYTGQFEAIESPYFDPIYIAGWCLVLTFLGLLSIRVVRPHVHLS